MRKTQIYLLTTFVFALTAATNGTGGTLSGKITGGKGATVVYIDAIPGKTFPAPAKHVVMDQNSLLFQPHIVVVQVGTTVDFLNSDKRAAQHLLAHGGRQQES